MYRCKFKKVLAPEEKSNVHYKFDYVANQSRHHGMPNFNQSRKQGIKGSDKEGSKRLGTQNHKSRAIAQTLLSYSQLNWWLTVTLTGIQCYRRESYPPHHCVVRNQCHSNLICEFWSLYAPEIQTDTCIMHRKSIWGITQTLRNPYFLSKEEFLKVFRVQPMK